MHSTRELPVILKEDFIGSHWTQGLTLASYFSCLLWKLLACQGLHSAPRERKKQKVCDANRKIEDNKNFVSAWSRTFSILFVSQFNLKRRNEMVSTTKILMSFGLGKTLKINRSFFAQDFQATFWPWTKNRQHGVLDLGTKSTSTAIVSCFRKPVTFLLKTSFAWSGRWKSIIQSANRV